MGHPRVSALLWWWALPSLNHQQELYPWQTPELCFRYLFGQFQWNLRCWNLIFGSQGYSRSEFADLAVPAVYIPYSRHLAQ
jgi:hypothetical protein